MQLVAYGAQDIYLTGNPQITFFKVVYRRHTNFAVESIEQTINGSVGSSSKVSVTVARNGDLLSRVYIQIKDNETGDQGFDAIDYVEVEVGGQVIDKHYGAWMKIWCDLTHGSDKKAMLNEMLCDAKGCGCGTSSKTSYIPLQFWFCRNPGLALPLIALQYHEVKLNVKFCNLKAGASAEVWCDYIFLDTDERRRFAQVSHEYLIEQVQYNNGSAIAKAANLRFNHPVKELVWRAVNPSPGCCGNQTGLDDICDVVLQLNGHDRFRKRSGDYFSVVQRYEHHTGARTSGADPMSTQAPGHPNAAKALEDMKTEIAAFKTSVEGVTAEVAGVVGEWDATAQGVTVGLVGALETARASLETALGTNTVNGELAGVLTAAGNLNTDISTNGNTAVKALTQPAALTVYTAAEWNNIDNQSQVATTTACVDAGCIYSYSFALKPEEHQPSGTCNFSRIDNAVMQVGLNTVTTASKLDIYAVNYNVLRIMSGMGGLAYSN